MRLYPDIPAHRAMAIAQDLVGLLLVAAFAWAGVQVHDAVDDLAAVGRGLESAGSAVEDGLRPAGKAVGDVPLIGSGVAGAFQDAGAQTSGRLADAGRSGTSAVLDLARILGWTTFPLPTSVLLALYVPWRLLRVRRLTQADRLMRGPATAERRRLLATRAAFHLPYGALAAYTQDPFGDLEQGRHDALVAAAFAEVGLRPPADPPG